MESWKSWIRVPIRDLAPLLPLAQGPDPRRNRRPPAFATLRARIRVPIRHLAPLLPWKSRIRDAIRHLAPLLPYG